MTDVRFAPTAIELMTAMTGVVGDVTNDPDSPDGNWLTATGNNTNIDVRVSFATPGDPPEVGADLQQFKAWVGQFDTNQTGDPNCRLELWENGVIVRAGTNVLITSGGQMITLSWNASEIGTSDGSLIECKVVGTKTGGSGAKRNTINVNAIEYNGHLAAAPSFTPKSSGLILSGMF